MNIELGLLKLKVNFCRGGNHLKEKYQDGGRGNWNVSFDSNQRFISTLFVGSKIWVLLLNFDLLVTN